MTPAEAILDGSPSRGDVKRRAALLDADPSLRAAVIALATSRGVVWPDDAVDWPARKLLRAALNRAASAQTRLNPIRRDEGFVCVACGGEVPPRRVTSRNHCPFCLASRHVDVVPGDRSEHCGGTMPAVSVSGPVGSLVLEHRCERCGIVRRNSAAETGDVVDDSNAIRRLAMARAAP